MLEARWSDTGVIIDISSNYQGDITCRREHYAASDVRKLGYKPGDDMDDYADGEMATRAEMIRHHLTPRILRKGIVVQ